ncbi:conserved hypothetical protein [Culex quinquefasciatus]|uniref:Uncharacterized protein n=1 Tax=Culex quinquefasciatus TaxID=7176 RepID=B0XI89_CULQU|nr:conserved hypothetical protein [Culex quinquefasciatus]|eukprot:XP_001869361.1 conserved hypothetical protein [Culex quinquefasciatus]
MIGRADIEGSKSHVAMNAWRPQASYPCVIQDLIRIFATTTKICASGGSMSAYARHFNAHHQTLLLAGVSKCGRRLGRRAPLYASAPVLLTKTWPTKHTDILYVDRHGPKGKGRPDVRTVAMTSCKNVMTGPEGTSILSLPIDSPSPWWRWERRASPETVYAGIHHAPGCTPRTGKPQVAAQAFRTERRYCGTSNQMPRGRCRACSHRWLTVS